MRRRIQTITWMALLSLAIAAAAFAEPIESICIIDEDTFDNSAPAILELAAADLCGGGDPYVCVNEYDPFPGNRAILGLPVGTIIGNGVPGGTVAPLLTGQLFDEGMFRLDAAPQSWVDAGPTTDGLLNYLLAEADGFGLNGEHLLDNIPGVTPLRTAELEAMIGETCCAVVYDSDISLPQGNLQGSNLGVVRFTLLDVGPDPGGSVLPDITIQIEDGTECFLPPVSVDDASWGRVKTSYR